MSDSGSEKTGQGTEGGRLSTSRERFRRGSLAARRRYEGSSAESMWQRLNAMDFINQAMQFAGLLLLAFLPFLIVISSLAGVDAATGIARHLGLNAQATKLVRELFNPASKTAAAVDIRGIIFAVFGGIGTAATLQAIYERLFALSSRGMRDFHRQLIWIGAVIGVATLAGWVGPSIRALSAGSFLLGIAAFILSVLFWLFTMWILLSDRVPWRQLVGPAVATSLFWIGLGVFSSFFFSKTVVGDYREYGQIGIVFALMSWLIAIGVVIILGAVVGMVWKDRGLSFSAAFKRLLRTRRRGVAGADAQPPGSP